MPTNFRRALIITADDFGLHASVNEAVERAYCGGILNAASLMLAAPAAADAIKRARRLPGLRVGLHLVLADGPALLPPAQIPDLVDAKGRFGNRMARDGARFFFLPRVRHQLEAEIRAQFEAFSATGLVLDHVNAHKHFHLHPTVLSLILKMGAAHGLRAVRLPRDARGAGLLSPWLVLMRARLERAGIAHNDYVCGLRESGAMDESALLAALSNLRDGVTEIYLHPATVSGASVGASMPGYRHADELAALLSPLVRQQLEASGVPRGGFADIFAAR